MQRLALTGVLLVQINYFPSRLDPVRHAERFPENRLPLSGPRERRMLEKENNFQQVQLSLAALHVPAGSAVQQAGIHRALLACACG